MNEDEKDHCRVMHVLSQDRSTRLQSSFTAKVLPYSCLKGKPKQRQRLFIRTFSRSRDAVAQRLQAFYLFCVVISAKIWYPLCSRFCDPFRILKWQFFLPFSLLQASPYSALCGLSNLPSPRAFLHWQCTIFHVTSDLLEWRLAQPPVPAPNCITTTVLNLYDYLCSVVPEVKWFDSIALTSQPTACQNQSYWEQWLWWRVSALVSLGQR